jgi:Family of unknown function (DUF5694)
MQLVSSELKTNILVLGTPHLNGLGDKYTPRLLDNVVKKLLEFRPDLICIEGLSGDVIEAMQSKGDVETLERFVGPWLRAAIRAQKLLRTKRAEAEQTVKKLLKQKRLSYEKRLELILHMLANYDSASAVLRWSYLPESTRQTQAVIPQKIAKLLNERLNHPSEVYSLAVRLARELKLKSITSIDDHNYSAFEYKSDKQFEKEMKQLYSLLSERNKKFMEYSDRRFDDAVAKDDLLPFYTYCNSPKFAKEIWDLEGESYLRTNLPSGFDRARLAQWEVRNLNMASHIRQAMMFHSGKKVLVVVGSSHKVFLERYLKPMLDLSTVQFNDI